jgi:CheY-like chemotaxis protein
MASPRCKPDRLHEDGPHPLGRGSSVWGAEAVPWKHEMASDRPESKASKDAAADLALPKEAGHKLGGARADFVASLGRKVLDLRAVLSALESDRRATGLRDELRRKLHALGAAARLLHFDAMATCIADAEGVLERAARGEPPTSSELLGIGQAIDDLPALAWGEGPPSAPAPAKASALTPFSISALVVGGEAVADALTEEGESAESIFECERTEHAPAALGLARSLAPDVVIVDSDVEGALELVEWLLDDPLTEPVPILVLGTFKGPTEEARFVALGVAKTLARPIAPVALRRACREVVDQREGRTMRVALGEPTLEQLGERLAEELRRALVDSVDHAARGCRVPLGEGAEVVGALWGAIARVREVITMRTNGAVRYSGDGPEGAVALAPWLHLDALASDRFASSGRGRGAAADVSLDRRCVIVADDDPGVTWFISDLLRSTGCVVHEALDGARALQMAYELSPELIVSDILMPGLDGFALCRALRRDVALRDTPVILLSWKEDLLQRVRELGASAAAYLRKESDARAIVARVREVLRPRARVEARLRGDGEVRGRLDGLTVHSLLKLVSALRTSARISIRDASFLYEVDLHNGTPRRATRTSADGSFQSGERVLAALLGVGAGRFVVAPLSPSPMAPAEGDLAGTLDAQLSRPIAFARMALDATTGANTMHVRSVALDEEMVKGYLLATPPPARALVHRIASGDSPRDLLLRGDVAPSLLEDVLADLAARGAILAVHSYGGQDLFRGGDESGLAGPSATPSPLPTSDLVARELPLVKEAAARRHRASTRVDSDREPRSSSASPSSLEDAVMRAMSDRSPSSPAPPSSERPPIIEPSELRPRSSNPPAAAPTGSLSSFPPAAMVPGTSSSGETRAAPDLSKTEPMQFDGTAAATEDNASREISIPIDMDPSRTPPPASSVSSAESSSTESSGEASKQTDASAELGQSSKLGVIIVGGLVLTLALAVIGGTRWLTPDHGTLAVEGAVSTPPGVTYEDIPLTVAVPDGQGLIDVAAGTGQAIRVDGAEPTPPREDGRVRLPAVVGTHTVSVGGAGKERSRSVQVRAGQATRVDFDEP